MHGSGETLRAVLGRGIPPCFSGGAISVRTRGTTAAPHHLLITPVDGGMAVWPRPIFYEVGIRTSRDRQR
jgi:hypothetical protein